MMVFDFCWGVNGIHLLDSASCMHQCVAYACNQFVHFLVYTIIMTVALVLAARKLDPLYYDEGVDVFRGMCEVLLLLCIIYNALRETYHFKRNICNNTNELCLELNICRHKF